MRSDIHYSFAFCRSQRNSIGRMYCENYDKINTLNAIRKATLAGSSYFQFA